MEELKQQIKIFCELMGSPEVTEAIAKMSWDLFTKLKEKGFTDDQAMQILGRWASNTGK